mmetsp:Transcript_7263/g.25965  ORF Transcript_7263/g.25965 Transcript_7263/m.25965 type:complete len:268 (+) Transcript_7263:570-1373(+)
MRPQRRISRGAPTSPRRRARVERAVSGLRSQRKAESPGLQRSRRRPSAAVENLETGPATGPETVPEASPETVWETGPETWHQRRPQGQRSFRQSQRHPLAEIPRLNIRSGPARALTLPSPLSRRMGSHTASQIASHATDPHVHVHGPCQGEGCPEGVLARTAQRPPFSRALFEGPVRLARDRHETLLRDFASRPALFEELTKRPGGEGAFLRGKDFLRGLAKTARGAPCKGLWPHRGPLEERGALRRRCKEGLVRPWLQVCLYVFFT